MYTKRHFLNTKLCKTYTQGSTTSAKIQKMNAKKKNTAPKSNMIPAHKQMHLFELKA